MYKLNDVDQIEFYSNRNQDGVIGFIPNSNYANIDTIPPNRYGAIHIINGNYTDADKWKLVPDNIISTLPTHLETIKYNFIK